MQVSAYYGCVINKKIVQLHSYFVGKNKINIHIQSCNAESKTMLIIHLTIRGQNIRDPYKWLCLSRFM